MSELQDALRRRFRSPAEALRHIGIDPAILEEGRDKTMALNHRQAGRLGRDDEEEARQEELKEILEDPGASHAEKISALITCCPDDQYEDLHQMLAETANDIRGGGSYRAHARDRLERRHARDARRRAGRDEPPPFPGRPRPGGEMDPLDRREGEDRRRMAGDMAYDGGDDSLTNFCRRFGIARHRIPARF